MKTNLIKFGAFAVIASIFLAILYNTMSNKVSGETRPMKAEFTNVSGLRPGDDVRVAGVAVGRVQKTAVNSRGLATVDFILQADQQIYRNTTMVVRYQNLLGQRYLALMPGTGGPASPLATGSTVPVSRTSPGFDLTALLNGFEPLFQTLDPEQINKLSASIVSVLQGEGGTVQELLDQTASLSTKLAGNDKVFGEVIDNLTPVLENMATRSNDFDNTINQFEALMAGLAKERTTIGDSIDSVSGLAEAASGLITSARPDLRSDLKTLSGLSQAVVANQKSIGNALDALPLALGAFSRPLSHGSWLNIYLCNVAVGLGANEVNLGGKNGPYSEVCR